MVRFLYDVLQVDRTATLDEIKLAFKRRALHVHPDKGGSEEAFHLVYHAFETLADPEARKKTMTNRLQRQDRQITGVAKRQQPAEASRLSQGISHHPLQERPSHHTLPIRQSF